MIQFQLNTCYYINYQSYMFTLNIKNTNTNRAVMGVFSGELIFLFITSISLHSPRIVSGFFLLNNDDIFVYNNLRL
jgi:hypothetical protein